MGCSLLVAVIILIFFHDHTISINHSLGNLLASRPKLQVAMNFQWTFSLTIALSFGIVAIAAASNDATLQQYVLNAPESGGLSTSSDINSRVERILLRTPLIGVHEWFSPSVISHILRVY
jgi:hypothetical protein